MKRDIAFALVRRRAVQVGRVVACAMQRFGDAGSAQAAAGMAYYALFSLFPTLVFLVVVASLFISGESVRQELIDFVGRALPISDELITTTVLQVLRQRGAISIVAAVGLLWSAAGFIDILTSQVNRAWPGARKRSFVEGRLLGLGIVAGLAILSVLWLVLSALLRLVPERMPLVPELEDLQRLLRSVAVTMVPWVFTLLLFLGLYARIPRVSAPFVTALVGALFATLAWRGVTAAFVWYLGSGLARYHLVYGSLSSIVALLFWMYLTNLIILFGAYLSAALHTAWLGKGCATPPSE
jgi:membrane protein